MTEGVALAKIAEQADVDQALGTAAILGRFAYKDVASILSATGGTPAPTAPTRPGP